MTDPVDDGLLRRKAALALAVPLPAALGAELIDPGSPPAGVFFRVGGLALNGAGGAHSAALSAILEAAGYLALLPHLAADEHAVTHSAGLLLEAAAPEGARVQARGSVDRRTSRLAFVTAVADVDGNTVARMQLVKSIVRMP